MRGLGACLLQEEKLVYFASKALTKVQKGYVAIEIESLAAAWAMEKFHHFLYASHFTLETDQKPLETILSISLNQATARLQRILIRTFPCHFTVHYIPGVTNQLANCLCRLGGQKDTVKLPKLHLYQITSQLCARSDGLNQLRVSIGADDDLCLVKTYHNSRMAKLNQTSSSHLTAILDFQGRTYYRRRVNLERYQNCHSS